MYSSLPVLEIDLNIIRKNYESLQLIALSTAIGASIKANAYGLGADYIAPILHKSGCRHFFVATWQEGVDLRSIIGKDAKIYVLHGVFLDSVEHLLHNDLTPVINHLGQLELWQNQARTYERVLGTVLHVNTGMYRLGMPQSEFLYLAENIDKANSLSIDLVMSHFTSSDEPKNPENFKQLELFKKFAANFPGAKRSLANSGGIFLGAENHFDIVRPGAAIYGLHTHPDAHKHIENSVSLYAPIIQIQEVPTGTAIGYNGTYTASRNMRIATIQVGYADGYMRKCSSKGKMFINNKQVDVVGRVSMDFVTLDVTELTPDECFVSQRVEILGKNQSPDNLAKDAETIGYEIITSLGNRYKKIYT